MDLDKVRSQIKKLLNLGNDEGATAAEAANALRFARRLMLKHQVDEEDLKELDPHELAAEVERTEYGRAGGWTVGKTLTQWESHLMSAVERLVGTVKSYYSTGVTRRTPEGVIERWPDGNPKVAARVTFYGPEEDARAAVELFEEWSVTIAAMARMKFGGAIRGVGRNYAEGFVSGMHERLAELQKEERALLEQKRAEELPVHQQCTALVVQNATSLMALKKERAATWLAEQGVKLGRARSGGGGGSYDPDARAAGRADGRKADFSHTRTKKLGGGS